MPIRSAGDIAQAFEDGRWHLQRVFKNASTTGDGQWIDWAFASGQPAFDARIGTAGAFNPFVAQRNDAVWFPSIDPTHERRLQSVTLATVAGGTGQTQCSAWVYDLLGVYPLIDGDSTDEQAFDNSLPLPRYESGQGVVCALVNHVAPMLTAADGVISYTDAAGVDRTALPFRAALTGQNKVVSALAGGGGAGAPANVGLALPGGGVRRVNSLQFSSAPGGLFALYMMRLLQPIANHDGNGTADKIATERCNVALNAWHLPRIFDGAHLGLLLMPSGGARTVSVFGDFTFIWG